MFTLLQINTTCGVGSTGRIVEDIGQLAISQGWKSYIAHGRGIPSKHSNDIQIGNKWSIALHGIMTRIFDRHGLASKQATRKLIKAIKEIKPDIIHLHNLHGYYINIELLFNYLSDEKIPIVWTLHDCWIFTGHCPHFSYEKCDKWQTECFNCPRKKEYPASYVFDRSKENFSLKKRLFTSCRQMTLVPVSLWLNNLLDKSFLGAFTKRVIYNGINISVFTPNSTNSIREKYNIGNCFFILGVANVWNVKKGLDDLKKMSTLLDANYVIVLIGLSEDQIRNLPKNIIGVKRTESIEELASFYSEADVFVNPTLEDNFPTTNLEALACGTPVITYNTGGSVEAVTPETGFIVEQGDIRGLKEAIDVVRNRGKNSYLKLCRVRAVEFFNKRERFQEYIPLYENILQDRL